MEQKRQTGGHQAVLLLFLLLNNHDHHDVTTTVTHNVCQGSGMGLNPSEAPAHFLLRATCTLMCRRYYLPRHKILSPGGNLLHVHLASIPVPFEAGYKGV